MCDAPANKYDLEMRVEAIGKGARNIHDIIENYKVLDTAKITDILQDIELNVNLAKADLKDIQYAGDACAY